MKLRYWLIFGLLFGLSTANKMYSADDIDTYGRDYLLLRTGVLGVGVGVIGFFLERLFEWKFKKGK